MKNKLLKTLSIAAMLGTVCVTTSACDLSVSNAEINKRADQMQSTIDSLNKQLEDLNKLIEEMNKEEEYAPKIGGTTLKDIHQEIDETSKDTLYVSLSKLALQYINLGSYKLEQYGRSNATEEYEWRSTDVYAENYISSVYDQGDGDGLSEQYNLLEKDHTWTIYDTSFETGRKFVTYGNSNHSLLNINIPVLSELAQYNALSEYSYSVTITKIEPGLFKFTATKTDGSTDYEYSFSFNENGLTSPIKSVQTMGGTCIDITYKISDVTESDFKIDFSEYHYYK